MPFLSRLHGGIMKNMVRKVLVKSVPTFLLGSCVFLVACSAPPDGDSSNGKRWFAMHHCDGCHGEGGLGGKAPRLRQVKLSYHELLSKVRQSKSAIMPSYSRERLPEQNVADILAYLQEEKR